MANIEKIEQNVPFTQKLSDFIQRNRSLFLIGFIVFVAVLAGFIATISIRSALNTKALTQVEDLNQRYETLRFDLNDSSKAADVQSLLDDLGAFASKHSGYAGTRSYALMASIYSDQKKWAEAFGAWNSAALAATKTYLEPVALYNAAVAAEEQGNIPDALELFAKTAANADFPAASRAQFAIGRLQEAQRNKDAALEAYRTLLDKWPNDQVWATLAQSRIVSLNVN
jgi:tetratricopeptide (TPR) repeat protein